MMGAYSYWSNTACRRISRRRALLPGSGGDDPHGGELRDGVPAFELITASEDTTDPCRV
jgi:hypothetical protein